MHVICVRCVDFMNIFCNLFYSYPMYMYVSILSLLYPSVLASKGIDASLVDKRVERKASVARLTGKLSLFLFDSTMYMCICMQTFAFIYIHLHMFIHNILCLNIATNSYEPL